MGIVNSCCCWSLLFWYGPVRSWLIGFSAGKPDSLSFFISIWWYIQFSFHYNNASGCRNFANKIFANWRFATGENPGVYWRKFTVLSPIGEIPKDALAKVQWTFASCDGSILTQYTHESNSQSNWRNSSRVVGESAVDFRQLAKFQYGYWRKFSGISPLAKVLLAKILLAKVGIPHQYYMIL
jgi:hypothetical protein